MKKFLTLLLLVSTKVIAAPQDYWPSTVQYFVAAESVSDRELRVASRLMSETEYSVFDLSYNDAVMTELEKSIPQSVIDKGESAVGRYIQEYVVPVLRDKTPSLAESKIGLSLAKTYKLEYVPAVVFDGRYVVYGLSVSKAVRHYQRWRDSHED